MKGSPMQRNFGIGASPVKQRFAKATFENLSDEPKQPNKFNNPSNRDLRHPSLIMDKGQKNKGTLKGKTEFQYDVVDPVKSKVRKGVKFLKNTVIAKGQQKVNETIIKGAKKVKNYFTKK